MAEIDDADDRHVVLDVTQHAAIGGASPLRRPGTYDDGSREQLPVRSATRRGRDP
jgi:hypothetical protein